MDEKIYKYIKEHSSVASPALGWVEKQTHLRTNYGRMLSGSVQGELMRMLVLMSGARRVLELGTFTGYSSICLAGALPEDRHLDTLEVNDELEDLILEGFRRAGVSEKITLHLGDCKKTLRALADKIIAAASASKTGGDAPECAPSAESLLYDMAFIDANKREYCEYYSLVLPLVRPGGWILADNVLWDGKVCEETVSQDRQTQGILRFNEMVAADPRVENVILPIRDGINLIRVRGQI